MKTLPQNTKPLTAIQYLELREHQANVRHNRRSDFFCAIYCNILKAIAAACLVASAVGIARVIILLIEN
jgi:hypothetical protein